MANQTCMLKTSCHTGDPGFMDEMATTKATRMNQAAFMLRARHTFGVCGMLQPLTKWHSYCKRRHAHKLKAACSARDPGEGEDEGHKDVSDSNSLASCTGCLGLF